MRRHWYNGTEMRSASEVGYARFADEHNISWRYEPVTFSDGLTTWTPDFALAGIPTTWGATGPIYVEVKYKQWLTEAHESSVRAQLANMLAVFASKPDATVILEQSGVLDGPMLLGMDNGHATLTECRWTAGGGPLPVLAKKFDAVPWHDAWWHQSEAA